MANPQAENGHTDIANEIVEALAKTYLNATESRVLWAILRKTYGWHKKTDRISFSQFEKITCINRRHIADAVASLISRKIITRRGNNYKLEYGLQKDYSLWESLPIQATNKVKHLNTQIQSLPIQATNIIVTHTGNTPLPIQATKSLPIQANTKETKETVQKKLLPPNPPTPFSSPENNGGYEKFYGPHWPDTLKDGTDLILSIPEYYAAAEHNIPFFQRGLLQLAQECGNKSMSAEHVLEKIRQFRDYWQRPDHKLYIDPLNMFGSLNKWLLSQKPPVVAQK